MSDLLKIRFENDLVVISLNNPPSNMLTQPLRAALMKKLADVQTDPRAKAIVLWAQGRMFSMGNDLQETGTHDQGPSLAELCDAIENSSKPVVAAMHGAALGGGLELALAAHARIATGQCALGLPEVKLGLSPSAGGTQRLARLCGAENTLKLLIWGSSTRANVAADWGIVDWVSNKDLWDEAQELALECVQNPPQRTRDLVAGAADPASFQKAVDIARKSAVGPLAKVKESLCQLVEAAQILPFETGMRMEAATFATLKDSRKFHALKHILFAERRVATAANHIKPVDKIGIYGDGPQAILIIGEAISADLHVLSMGLSEQSHSAIVQIVHHNARQKLRDEDHISRILSRLVQVTDIAAFDDVDLIIDATKSNGADIAKRYPIPTDGQIKPLGIFNPARDVDRLNELMGDHGKVIKILTPPFGVLELVAGRSTKSSTIGSFQSFCKRLNRIGMPVREPARKPLAQAQTRAVIWMLKHGASVQQIDQAMVRFGYRAGPFQRMDIDGIAKLQAQRSRKAADPFWIGLVDRMCASGRVGIAAKRGFYNYDDRARCVPASDDFTQGLQAEREAVGAPQFNWSSGQIQLRDLAALLSAGCELTSRAAVSHPSEIDVFAVASMGFPRWRGGPMKAAQAHGLVSMQLALRKFQHDDENIWSDSAVLSEAIKTAQGFDAL